jgi:hypothetical protein
MRLAVLLVLLFFSASIKAAPFLICDPSTQVPPVTSYSILKTDTVTNVTTKSDHPLVNKACKHDLAGTQPGKYVFKATFFYVDPLLGRQESVPSVPFTLTLPDIIQSPSGISVMPQ